MVVLGALAAAAAVLFWRLVWIPERAESLYGRGYDAYLAGDFAEARDLLERVREIDPDRGAGVSALLGWSEWRLGRPEDALESFARARAADSTRFEALWGLGMARHALARYDAALDPLERAHRIRPTDMEVRRTLADTYRRTGHTLRAVELHRELLETDPANVRAEQALLEIFGYPSLDADLPLTLPEYVRPDTFRLPYRASGDYLQVRDGGRWRDVYLTGVNLGPGQPGEFAVDATWRFEQYGVWLEQIAAMGANTVRTYTILPPAFYQAFLAHNRQAPEPLWLIQEVWLPDEAQDLWEPATVEDFEAELRDVVDLLHGNADIACVPSHHCGIYTADVSPWTIGIGVGREVEPSLVKRTNRKHPERTSWEGRWISVDGATPSEAWFAKMFDLAAGYERERYNAQRPLTIVSWPPLDPMSHPTEATYAEEMEVRRSLGEIVPDTVPLDMNDMDAVTLDVTRFRLAPDFGVGVFALYHVYQHWPDFVFLQPSYAEARDAQGVNRYLGYLRDLKAAYDDIPLLIGEYGLATSIHPAHVHPEGWGNGGLTEEEQARLLVRYSRNIRDTDMAGGIVFAWIDEWWKQVHDAFIGPMEGPRHWDPLWVNHMDPEELFGIVGYRAFDTVPRLRGRPADWERADTLYGLDPSGSAGGDTGAAGSLPPWTLERVLATRDYGDLHLRVDVADGAALDWDDHEIWLALNTLPGAAGSTELPELELDYEHGATFLVRLDGAGEGRILVSRNYDPWEPWTVPGRPDRSRILTRQGMTIQKGPSPFQEIVIEANLPRYGRDSTEFPAINHDRSPLRYGSLDPAHPEYTSDALWRIERDEGMVELRLPWSLILVRDPTRMRVFGGTDDDREPLSRVSPGVTVTALVVWKGDGVEATGPAVLSSFPRVRAGFEGVRRARLVEEPALYDWGTWEKVRYRPYFKPAYGALTELWRSWPRYLN